MVKNTVQGDVWYSETVGYTIVHSSNGLVSRDTGNRVRVSQNFLRATDWVKIEPTPNKNTSLNQ